MNWVRQGSSTTFETGLRNVQKNVMHVQSCCFANKTYCFFWCTVTAKTSKTNGCFLLLRKTLLVHFVFCITYLGCLYPFETPRNYQTKTINKNKNEEPCQNESFASRYFFLFPSIRSPVLGYQVENASPNHFDPGLPRNLKVANRKVLKKIEDFVSILWTLYEVDVSFVHELLVTARDKHRSYN